jgi:alpha-2-macroglobulin
MQRDKLGLFLLASVSLLLAGIAQNVQSDERKNLLDEFRQADVPRRLQLLPRLTKAYSEEELPPEVRYLLALQLLRPHLTWQAPNLFSPKEDRQYKHLQEMRQADDAWRWSEALGAEAWMFSDVPADVRDLARNRLAEWKENSRAANPGSAGPGDYAWRLKDPKHIDVAKAVRLLSAVQEGELGRQARRWVEEIGRNNTVLTFDVAGSFGAGKTARLTLDARNAPRLKGKLFRVQRPEDLLWVAQRIGRDFIFRDHGLQDGVSRAREQISRLAEAKKAWKESLLRSVKPEPVPEALQKDPVWEFASATANLKTARIASWGYWDGYDQEIEERADDGDYFEDSCERHQDRLRKSYRPGCGRWTSWQCDCLIEIPGKALAEPGTYVLAVESGGQVSYAPLVVEPLSLTLRRCRDGVFVAVADTEGKKPVAGAAVHGRDMLGSAATDAEGVAFAKLYAGGDRIILVHKDGRFAVGGFGRVFEGIYHSPLEFPGRHFGRDRKESERKTGEGQAQVYADRHVVAAYTDRPAYRPDQEVRFKVIVRRLAPDKVEAKDRPQAFRAEDFELASRLEVPTPGTRVPYALLDPKGRAVATGELTLNDFGAAAGAVRLNAETAVGTYALRLRLAGVERIVPEVCAVEYYRLPTFQLEVKGVPEKVRTPEDFRVELSGAYSFGKPLAGGRVEVRLMSVGSMRSAARGEAVLDARGNAVVKLEPAKNLAPGRYVVRCDLSDDESGRTVHRILPYTIEALERPRTGLAALPRFVPLDQPLEFPTTVDIVRAELVWRDQSGTGTKSLQFVPSNGKAALRFPCSGWYTLTAGKDSTDVFVYGGFDNPGRTRNRQQEKRLKQQKASGDEWEGLELPGEGWVDLTDDREDGSWSELFNGREVHLLALFDRQQANVGGVCRVLVYVPAKRSRLLFTMEGFTVLDYLVAKVDDAKGYYHVIEIPIKRQHLPHFYLRGRILEAEGIVGEYSSKGNRLDQKKVQEDFDDGRDPRWCRIDVVDPKALPGGERLRVEIQTDRAEYKPGDKVDVRLKVTDREGKTAAAEVSLAVVDARVYAFGTDRLSSLAALFDDPHPGCRFYAKAWRSSVGNRWAKLADLGRRSDDFIESLQKSAKQMAEAKDGRADAKRDSGMTLPPAPSLTAPQGELPVVGMPLARLRSDFRETAVWLPQLRTDANGELRTTFKLPDSLTSYQLSAVALTKTTEIGTRRAELRTTLPLAVQVVLPRFAVEGDRLAAVGVIHNNGPRDRVCGVAWHVEGGVMDGQLEQETKLAEWKQDGGAATGQLMIPAGKTAHVGLWVKCDRIGSAKVQFRCRDGIDGDAEVRALSVQALGRERSVSFDGAFTDATKVRLPAGFAARDVHIVLSRNNIAQSLDGVAGLVDYPYGCVEQSMSRFLPAVLVREAGRRGSLSLPPDVEAKLPLVLEQGLTRLYKFQHADGGWGWWENDKTDPRMTVYVVYGLARCAGVGVPVDQGVLARGTAWLKAALDDGRLTGLLAARAHLALAHAGQADAKTLSAFADHLLTRANPLESRCVLALACRTAGLSDAAKRLWAAARDWQPETAEETALLLKAQVAFAEPMTACHRSAARLMKRRTGLGWENTQATANALDALSLLIPLLTAETPLKSVRIAVADREALNLSKPDELKSPGFRVRLSGEQLPNQDPLEITLNAEGGAAVYYTVEASGTQRLDKVAPIGDVIKVSRTFETLDGLPLAGNMTQGQTLAVRLRVLLEKPCSYLLVEDRRPAGCEFADDHLHGKDAAGLANVEFRDDRVCAFAAFLPAGQHEFVYYLRAETAGVSQVLPGRAYPMYEDKVRGETGAARLEILWRKR